MASMEIVFWFPILIRSFTYMCPTKDNLRSCLNWTILLDFRAFASK